MTPETIFQVSGYFAMCGWVLLIFFGHKRVISGLVTGLLLPLMFSALYLSLVAIHASEWKGGFGSLAEVATLFSNPWFLLAGWVHYLAFDLFVGSWQVRDAGALGVSPWIVEPCLILTFLFGPVGLLAYCLLRAAMRRRWAIDRPH